MLQTVDTLRSTAEEAREAFERRSIPRSLLKDLYLEYQPSTLEVDNFDINYFLDYAERIFPKGNCGIASIYLKHVLGAGEVVEGLYIVEPHQFLEVGKLAVDITADQFGGPPVYVGPIDLPWSRTEL